MATTPYNLCHIIQEAETRVTAVMKHQGPLLVISRVFSYRKTNQPIKTQHNRRGARPFCQSKQYVGSYCVVKLTRSHFLCSSIGSSIQLNIGLLDSEATSLQKSNSAELTTSRCMFVKERWVKVRVHVYPVRRPPCRTVSWGLARPGQAAAMQRANKSIFFQPGIGST